MNIYKRAKLRNLTNEELIKLLQESNWYDADLLREYNERKISGRIEVSPSSFEKTPAKAEEKEKKVS